MLILCRKVDQIVRINDYIQIMLTSIKNKKVSLGIKAHKDIRVYREEVYQLRTQK